MLRQILSSHRNLFGRVAFLLAIAGNISCAKKNLSSAKDTDGQIVYAVDTLAENVNEALKMLKLMTQMSAFQTTVDAQLPSPIFVRFTTASANFDCEAFKIQDKASELAISKKCNLRPEEVTGISVVFNSAQNVGVSAEYPLVEVGSAPAWQTLAAAQTPDNSFPATLRGDIKNRMEQLLVNEASAVGLAKAGESFYLFSWQSKAAGPQLHQDLWTNLQSVSNYQVEMFDKSKDAFFNTHLFNRLGMTYRNGRDPLILENNEDANVVKGLLEQTFDKELNDHGLGSISLIPVLERDAQTGKALCVKYAFDSTTMEQGTKSHFAIDSYKVDPIVIDGEGKKNYVNISDFRLVNQTASLLNKDDLRIGLYMFDASAPFDATQGVVLVPSTTVQGPDEQGFDCANGGTCKIREISVDASSRPTGCQPFEFL